jgi:hypothetical protein
VSQPDRPPSGLLVQLLAIAVALLALISRRPARRLPPGVDVEDLAAGYEVSDLSPRALVAVLVGGLAAFTILLVFVTTLGVAFTGLPIVVGSPPATVQPALPVPRLEVQSGQSLAPYLAAEQRRLNAYRWIDRQAGIAAIPIDRAMDLVAQRGLPARPEPVVGTTAPSVASSGRVDEAYP